MRNQQSQHNIQAEERALHAACIKGDIAAERQLYDRYRGRMFAMCMRYASSRSDAEDILQEGFLTVFRDLKGFRCEGSLEGWVRRVILNVAFKHLRKEKDNRTYELSLHLKEEEVLPDSFEQETNTTAKQLIVLMQKLPRGFRTVLNLYIIEGYTHAEIAEILNISIGTSKSQYMRAKAALKLLFEQKLMNR